MEFADLKASIGPGTAPYDSSMVVVRMQVTSAFKDANCAMSLVIATDIILKRVRAEELNYRSSPRSDPKSQIWSKLGNAMG